MSTPNLCTNLSRHREQDCFAFIPSACPPQECLFPEANELFQGPQLNNARPRVTERTGGVTWAPESNGLALNLASSVTFLVCPCLSFICKWDKNGTRPTGCCQIRLKTHRTQNRARLLRNRKSPHSLTLCWPLLLLCVWLLFCNVSSGQTGTLAFVCCMHRCPSY